MGIGAVIAAVGVGISAAGTVAGIIGQQQAASASKRAERLREQQMNLDAARSKRETVRRTLMAQAQAQSVGTNQGAGDSSSLSGALGEIGSVGGRNQVATNQNQAIGAGIFQANRDIASGESTSSFGQGLGSLGGMFVNNAQQLGRIFGG